MEFEELLTEIAAINKPWKPEQLRGLKSVSFGVNHAAGIREDGTAVAVGDNSAGQLEVSAWTDLVQISCGKSHTVGLKRDGTVVAAGDNSDGQRNVQEWKDIVSIGTPYWQTVGIRRDGTTVDVGYNYDGPNRHDLASYRNVVRVFAGSIHVLCLCADGMVMATGGYTFDPAINEHVYSQECVTAGWHHIVDVACGKDHSVGLRADGALYACGSGEDYGQWQVSDIKDAIRIGAVGSTTVIAHADGRLEARGFYRYDSLRPERGIRVFHSAASTD